MEEHFKGPFSRPSDKRASVLVRKFMAGSAGVAQHEIAPETMTPIDRAQAEMVLKNKDLALRKLREIQNRKREELRHLPPPTSFVPATGATPFDNIESLAKSANAPTAALAPKDIVLVGTNLKPVGWEDEDDDDGLDDIYD